MKSDATATADAARKRCARRTAGRTHCGARRKRVIAAVPGRCNGKDRMRQDVASESTWNRGTPPHVDGATEVRTSSERGGEATSCCGMRNQNENPVPWLTGTTFRRRSLDDRKAFALASPFVAGVRSHRTHESAAGEKVANARERCRRCRARSPLFPPLMRWRDRDHADKKVSRRGASRRGEARRILSSRHTRRTLSSRHTRRILLSRHTRRTLSSRVARGTPASSVARGTLS